MSHDFYRSQFVKSPEVPKERGNYLMLEYQKWHLAEWDGRDFVAYAWTGEDYVAELLIASGWLPLPPTDIDKPEQCPHGIAAHEWCPRCQELLVEAQ